MKKLFTDIDGADILEDQYGSLFARTPGGHVYELDLEQTDQIRRGLAQEKRSKAAQAAGGAR